MKQSWFMRALRRKLRGLFGFKRTVDILGRRIKCLRERNCTLKEEVVRLRRITQYDSLTGILNRVGFAHEWDRFSSEFSRGHWQSGALLFIDLNGFKSVNDHFGHSTGDKALQKVAEALAREVRPGDAVARLGGDEFIILLPGVSFEGVNITIDRLRSVIRKLLMDDPEVSTLAEIGGRGYVLDFSAGFYFLSGSGHTLALGDAIAHAESNMPKMQERRNLLAQYLLQSDT